MDNNGVPPVDAEEQKALDELKKLQTANQADVAADAKLVDVREAESKEMEAIEKSDPASLAAPAAPPVSDFPIPAEPNDTAAVPPTPQDPNNSTENQ